MRRFELRGHDDVAVAEGVQFSTGECAVSWLGGHLSLVITADLGTLGDEQTLGGKIVWIDADA